MILNKKSNKSLKKNKLFKKNINNLKKAIKLLKNNQKN